MSFISTDSQGLTYNAGDLTFNISNSCASCALGRNFGALSGYQGGLSGIVSSCERSSPGTCLIVVDSSGVPQAAFDIELPESFSSCSVDILDIFTFETYYVQAFRAHYCEQTNSSNFYLQVCNVSDLR